MSNRMIGICSLGRVWLGSDPAPVSGAEVAECSITHPAEMPTSSQAAGSVLSLCYCPRLDLKQTAEQGTSLQPHPASPGAPQPKGPVPKIRHPSGFKELWRSQRRRVIKSHLCSKEHKNLYLSCAAASTTPRTSLPLHQPAFWEAQSAPKCPHACHFPS